MTRAPTTQVRADIGYTIAGRLLPVGHAGWPEAAANSVAYGVRGDPGYLLRGAKL
jgi:hypothetical protein